MKKLLIFIALLISINSLAQVTKVIIPFPPGGGTDTAFKHFQKYTEKKYNITLVPVYEPGADSLIGLSKIAGAKNDGSILGFATVAGLATHKSKHPDYQFDYVSMISKSSMAVVTHTNSGIKNINDLESEIKTSKTIKSFAFGAPAQKIALNQLFFHNNSVPPDFIPYKGASPLLNDLLGGHVDVAVVPLNVVKSHIDSKKLVLIATTANITGTINLYKRYTNWESNDGFAIFLPNNSNTEVHKFWINLIQRYLIDPSTLEYFTTEQLEPTMFGTSALKTHVDAAVKNIK